jgi:hypothetical protein
VVPADKKRALQRMVLWRLLTMMGFMLTTLPILLGTVTAWSVGLVVAAAAAAWWVQWRVWRPRR